MKRQQDRDISPRNKRPRGSYVSSDHDISRNSLTPDMDRRTTVGANNAGSSSNNSSNIGGAATKLLSTGGAPNIVNRGGSAGKSYRTSYDHNLDHSRKPYRDDRVGGGVSSDYNVHHNSSSSSSTSSRTAAAVDNRQPPPPPPPSSSSAPLLDMYRSLCISNLNSKISEPLLIETLRREFERFGAFNIRMSYSGDQMVAYINFRYPEDARAARHDKSDLVLFDRQLRVEPVLNNRRRSDSPSASDYVPRLGPLLSSSGSDRFANRSISPAQPPSLGGPGRRTSRNMNPPRDISRERDYLYSDSRHPNIDKNTQNPRHPSPETEEKATRTLFVGNLDHNITETDLRRHFERFGVVEDVDIKRQQRAQGNSYAFVKFINLDCAHRAKVEMSGKHIGKFLCKIGYGKVTPTTCLWVGGLGPWINYQTLDREFDRFGAIKSIVWPHGKTYAYVLYDSIDAAQAAFQEMRRNPFGEKEFSLRVDFSDSHHIPCSPPQSLDEKYESTDHIRTYATVPYGISGGDQRRSDGFVDPHGSNKVRPPRDSWHPIESDPINVFRNPDNPRDFEHRGSRIVDQVDRSVSLHVDRRKRGHSPIDDFDNQKRYRSHSRERVPPYRNRDNEIRDHGNKLGMKLIPEQQPPAPPPQPQPLQPPHLGENFHEKDVRGTDLIRKARPPTEKELSVAEHVNNLVDLAKCLPVAWNGALILKNSAFLARMHVVSGDVTIVDTLMRDPTTTETSVLRITQRLRLDQPKLEEVGRRVSSSGSHGHCILLALPSTLPNYEVGQAQQRPLKNLVSYLKQKEAAGVISLPPNPSKDKENVGVLHAFPPCQFGYNFLLGCAPKLPPEPIKEDYLVVIVVRGAT